MVDPSIWQDEGMAELTARQQLLYIGLFSNADDAGRMKGSPSALRLALPTLYAGQGLEEVADDLAAVCSTMTQIVVYTVDRRQYLAFKNYAMWQRIDRPSKSLLPPPPEVPDDSPTPPRIFDESSPSTRPQVKLTEEKLTEEKVTEVSRAERDAPAAHDPDSEPVPLSKASNRRHEQTFEAFWAVWPKREGKAKALASWLRLKPKPESVQAIIEAISRHQVAKNWARENWRYCPLPATWLNERRWDDELPEVSDDDSGRPTASGERPGGAAGGVGGGRPAPRSGHRTYSDGDYWPERRE